MIVGVLVIVAVRMSVIVRVPVMVIVLIVRVLHAGSYGHGGCRLGIEHPAEEQHQQRPGQGE
jgi:hypothetical protein